MRVIVVKDQEMMGQVAWEIMEEAISDRPAPVLGLATGSTPLPLYAEMVKANKAGDFDFATTLSFNLDEYLGLPGDHAQSYRHFMNTNLFDHININKANTFVPDGMADDPELSCAQYEMMMEDVGGVHFQVLGIGSNGHIAFNEPGSSLASRTRVVDLTDQTIDDNSRFFEKKEDVPTQAVSMGIGTILESEQIILLATGANKVDAVAAALEGPITCMNPATALQMHQDVTYVVTADAAGKLTRQVEKA